MTMIVEDGTSVANSNSYLSVAEADAYHTLYGNTDWAGETTYKELALMNASNAIDLMFGDQFMSVPQYSDQSMLFPRFAFVIHGRQIINSNSIPRALKLAVAELALKHLSGEEIYLSQSSDKTLKANRIVIGEIEISNDYRSAPTADQYSGLEKIEMYLKPLLRKTTKSGVMSL